MQKLIRNKKTINLSIVIMLLVSITSFMYYTNSAQAETITVTGSLKAEPGFYWCQHQDGSWSTYSSFEDQTYTSPNDNGEPAKKWVKTYANISSKPSTFFDAAGNPYSLSEVRNATPVNADMNGDADPNMQGQPTIVSGQVVIEGYSGQGISGVSNSSICGGNPGMIYSFPVDVFYEAEVQVDLSINPNSQTIDEGNSATYDALLNEQNVTTDSQTTWSINDTSIATIDQSGNVTGVSGGTTTVTATYEDTQLGVNLTATAEVTVNQSEEPPPEPEPDGPVADFDWSPSAPEAEEEVTFEDQSTHPDNLEIVEWEWEYSNDTFGTSSEADYTFGSEGSKSVTLTVTDENGKSDSITRSLIIAEANESPYVNIAGKEIVYVGETRSYNILASDPDGDEIVDYKWGWSGVPYYADVSVFSENSIQVTFKNKGDVGEFVLHGEVTDARGARGFHLKEDIEIREPIPEAIITASGILKENRVVNIDFTDSIPPGSVDILWEDAEVDISPLDNQSTSSIKYDGVLDGSKAKSVVFKEKGKYEISLKITNEFGYTDTTTKIITIELDEPPIADFSVNKQSYRDGNDKRASFNLIDESTSPDYDPLNKRIWYYKYDSDNDGDFSDESVVILDSTNSTSLTFKPKEVGKYLLNLKVVEGINTTSDFVTANDGQSDDTEDQVLSERTVEVLNRAPRIFID